MIGVAHRFHGYNSLRNVYKRGQNVRGSLVSLRFALRGPTRPYRAAVVVSRKVSKSAVVRNRIRRRIYEIVRQSGNTIDPGTDLVFTVFSDQVAELPPPKLKTLIDELLSSSLRKD
jgi:ribonuclease P protein component